MAEVVQEGVHNYSSAAHYVRPQEPLLRERLEWFQDQKLSLMLHWGPYSQLGLVESWALSDEDAPWSRADVEWTNDGALLREQYFALNRTFNPIRFAPDDWAALAVDCGFKYLVFTTKHHDGFCMWDTAYSDYRITAPDCPFHAHPRADIVREVFDAFRARGLGIAAYFSKADWRSPYYWSREFPAAKTSRGPSYEPASRPDLWESFRLYTKNQVLELCRNYGRLDVLWFDAGWVHGPRQDIDIEDIVLKAREIQPWLLAADRTCGGACENYVTPEQCVPDSPLIGADGASVPWESCVTVGTQFSFRYEDRYKTGGELVRLLCDVVSCGGNLALNVGPQPDGRLPAGAVASLRELGDWLRLNGEAIYGTRACAPYKAGSLRFTQKAGVTYVIALDGASEANTLVIPWTRAVSRVRLLGALDAAPLSFARQGGSLRVTLPPSSRARGAALALALEADYA